MMAYSCWSVADSATATAAAAAADDDGDDDHCDSLCRRISAAKARENPPAWVSPFLLSTRTSDVSEWRRRDQVPTSQRRFHVNRVMSTVPSTGAISAHVALDWQAH